MIRRPKAGGEILRQEPALLELYVQLAESDLLSSSPSVQYHDAYNVVAVRSGRQDLPATRVKSVWRYHRCFSRECEPVRSVWRVLGFSIASARQSRWPDRDHESD